MLKQSRLFSEDSVIETNSESNVFEDYINDYDELKEFNGIKYTGMKIGAKHKWHYDNGIWEETKVSPDKWNINFKCIKNRFQSAPQNSGAGIGSGFHWYIIADQQAIKIDNNRYDTIMTGIKYKVGHKRPDWQKWSYKYPGQMSYKEIIIQILENMLEKLKNS
jgi:hypothetical protein